MFELSSLCVDRTFLLISWDPSCVTAGNMPYHLVVRSYDHGPTCLNSRDQYYRTNNGINGDYHLLESVQFALGKLLFYLLLILEDLFMIRILMIIATLVLLFVSYYLFNKQDIFLY